MTCTYCKRCSRNSGNLRLRQKSNQMRKMEIQRKGGLRAGEDDEGQKGEYRGTIWVSLTFKVCRPSATFQVYWPMGFHINAWASPASSGLAGAYLYLDICIEWTKIVIMAHISNWDSLTCTQIYFHRGSYMWSQKMLIVPVALPITGIVIMTPKVVPGPFFD